MTSPQQADVYQREQQAAVMAAVAAAGVAAGMAGLQLANFTVFMRFLRGIWPAVLGGRRRASWSARQFFDRERARVTGLPQLDVPLIPDYRFEWFVNDMRPAFDLAVKQIRVQREAEKQGVAVPPAKIESTVRVVVAKVVADAGRDQMIANVEADATRAKNLRETRKEAEKLVRMRKTWGDNWIEDTSPAKDLDSTAPNVIGWARVATGDETCAWCMMLVSRGTDVLYRSAETAGAGSDSEWLTDAEVVDLFGAGADIPMNDWHVGCDCTVVPVFDMDDWPGKRQAEDALEQWKAAGADFVYDPDKKYRMGKLGTKDYSFTPVTEGVAKYRETLNNLRFMVEGRDPKDRQRVSDDQIADILKSVPGAAKLFAKELSRR